MNRAHQLVLALLLLAIAPATKLEAALSFGGNACLKLAVEGYLRDAKIAPEIGKLSAREFSGFSIETKLKLLTQKFDQQVGGWRKEDVKTILDRVPSAQQDVAKEFLFRMTRFGNMEATFKFAEILPSLIKDTTFLTLEQGTFADAINYLQTKSGQVRRSMFESLRNIKLIQGRSKNMAMIVDAASIRILEADPVLQKKIRDYDVKLIVIPGLAEGVTIFNQSKKADVAHSLQTHVKQFAENNATDPDAILIETTTAKLRALNLDTHIEIVKFDSRTSGSSPPAVASLTARVSPKRINVAELREAFAGRSEPELQQILVNFYEEGFLLSTSTIAENSKIIHDEVPQHAKELGVEPKDLYYVAPETAKSYQVLLGIYAEVNAIPVNRMLDRSQLYDLKGKTVVVIDDFAGTGDSLVEAGQLITKMGGTPILAAQVSTAVGAGNITSKPSGSRFRLVIGKQLEDLRQSDYYQNLSPEQKMLQDRNYLGGWGGASKVAFEYMSPDNNVETFYQTVSPLFTLRPAAIKKF